MESNSLSNNNGNESFKTAFQLKEKIVMILHFNEIKYCQKSA